MNSASHRLIAFALSSAMMLSGEAAFAADDALHMPSAQLGVLTVGGQPLREALKDPSAQLLQAAAQWTAAAGRNNVMFWGGIGLATVGLVVTAWELAPYTEGTCANQGSQPTLITIGGQTRLALDGECTPTTHLAGLFWTGVGMAALGTTFAVMGGIGERPAGRGEDQQDARVLDGASNEDSIDRVATQQSPRHS